MSSFSCGYFLVLCDRVNQSSFMFKKLLEGNLDKKLLQTAWLGLESLLHWQQQRVIKIYNKICTSWRDKCSKERTLEIKKKGLRSRYAILHQRKVHAEVYFYIQRVWLGFHIPNRRLQVMFPECKLPGLQDPPPTLSVSAKQFGLIKIDELKESCGVKNCSTQTPAAMLVIVWQPRGKSNLVIRLKTTMTT